jgi:hypothetical protein
MRANATVRRLIASDPVALAEELETHFRLTDPPSTTRREIPYPDSALGAPRYRRRGNPLALARRTTPHRRGGGWLHKT